MAMREAIKQVLVDMKVLNLGGVQISAEEDTDQEGE
jgi:hypothetical protein